MKKRILAIFLASFMAVGLIAGCGGKSEEKTTDTKEETQKEEATTI